MAFNVSDLKERSSKLPALPRPTLDLESLERGLQEASEEQRHAALSLPSPAALTRVLAASAHPLSGFRLGFVSDETTRAFLGSVTIGQLLPLLVEPGSAYVNAGVPRPLFDPSTLDTFISAVRDSMLAWANDLMTFVEGPEPPPVFVEKSTRVPSPHPDAEEPS